jgi:hypothetical protein
MQGPWVCWSIVGYVAYLGTCCPSPWPKPIMACTTLLPPSFDELPTPSRLRSGSQAARHLNERKRQSERRIADRGKRRRRVNSLGHRHFLRLPTRSAASTLCYDAFRTASDLPLRAPEGASPRLGRTPRLHAPPCRRRPGWSANRLRLRIDAQRPVCRPRSCCTHTLKAWPPRAAVGPRPRPLRSRVQMACLRLRESSRQQTRASEETMGETGGYKCESTAATELLRSVL